MENLKSSLDKKEFNVIRMHQNKIAGRWITTKTEYETFTAAEKDRFLSKDTLRWFRNLGGKESVKQSKYKGIGCTLNTSMSPDGTERKLNYFFD